MSAGLLVEQLRGGGAASLPLPHQARHYRVCCFRQGRTVRNWVRRRNLDPRLRTSRTSSAVSSRRTVASCRRCAEHQKGWEATLIGLWWCIACQQGKRRRWRKKILPGLKRGWILICLLFIFHTAELQSHPRGRKSLANFGQSPRWGIFTRNTYESTQMISEKKHICQFKTKNIGVTEHIMFCNSLRQLREKYFCTGVRICNHLVENWAQLARPPKWLSTVANI